jgi:hypothetical protein
MSKRHTFSSSDEELNEFLQGRDNKSAFIEAAVRRRMWESSEKNLTQAQQKAMDWLRMRIGTDMIEIETAKNRIAQLTNKSKELVMQDVIKPLENKGMIRVITGVSTVSIEVKQ